MNALIHQYVKNAAMKAQNGFILVYRLPKEEISKFGGLFDALDLKRGRGEITSYAVTISTMEDVFHK